MEYIFIVAYTYIILHDNHLFENQYFTKSYKAFILIRHYLLFLEINKYDNLGILP